MGSLRTLTILLALGAWGAATEGAPPGDDTSPSNGTTRAPLPAPAVEYLKGGIRLYNTGDQEKASKYLKVANDYRDQLQPSDVAQLDAYLSKLNPAAAPTDPAVQPASTDAMGSPAPMGTTAASSMPPVGSPRGTSDPKSEARWKLQAAREQIRMGNYDEAARIVVEVQKMNIKWGLFEETPAKVAEAIAKSRPKATASASSGAAHDKKAALARLKEAKDLLANNQYDQAEAIAMDVKTWGLSYGMMEEKPDRIASAARALRKRDELRSTPVKQQPSLEQYDVLVSEARHFIATGQLELAESKANQALRMNVYPTGTADRAESVLNDIAVAKASANALPASQPVAVAAAPAAQPAPRAAVAETPSLVAEREANALLARGQGQEAAAKFVEAENLRAREMAQPTSVASNLPAVDRSVQRVVNSPALEAPAQIPAQAEPPVVGSSPAGLPALGAPDAGPAPIPGPSSPPVAMPVAEAAPLASAPPSLSSESLPAGNKGEELMAQAKSLFAAGNYAAAREKVTEAKAGNYGMGAQADEMLAQIGLSEQGGALAVYEAALDAMRKGEMDRARAYLNEVAASGAALDPAMLEKVQGLLMKLPKEGMKGTATASDVPVNDAETLKAQQMNAEVGTKVAEARRMMEVDPDKAIELLQTTLASVKAAELPQTVSRTMVRRIEVALELSKTDKAKFDERMKDKNAKAEIETRKLRILEADKVKKTAIKELMTKAEEANAKGDYAKAEELARRAQEIDPNEIGPQMLAFKANMQRHYEVDVENKRKKEEGFLGAMQDVDAAMIIDNDAMRNGITFPKSFKEMSERRKKMQMGDTRQKSMQELATEKKLNEPITLNLKDQTFEEAIAFITNYTGLNVIVDTKALQDEGLSRESKVNITANSIKLKSALKYMLSPLGLTYKAEDDVLLITSPQASRDKTYTWTYPVADLVVPPNRPQGNSSPATPGAADAANSMSPNGALGPQAATNGSNWSQAQRTVTIADMMPLVQLITTTIAPNTWQVAYPDNEQNAYGMGGAFGGAGGGDAPAQPGSITPFLLSISLIIRHTAEVHEEVAELLKQLRRLQDLQVSIEVRFITVSDDFFEQIGVDFDFSIQSKTVGKGTSFAAPAGSVQASQYPFSLVNSTTTGGTAGTTTGGTAGGGATTGGGTGSGTTTGGTTGGGTTTGGGGTGGGTGGVSGGGFAGGGGGIGGAGNFGGGGTGTAGGTAGGTTGGSTSGTQAAYIVNPFLDNSLGRRTPIVVGTSSGGIGNFSSNLNTNFTQGSASNIQPFNSIPSAGATFGISFLSDLEMFLFLTAAQGDARNNIVQAPKVTTFNGANATITNAEIQYYISQLTPIVGPASVSFFPTPAPLNDGVTLNVTPVVSADRRYVRLSLAPFFQTINGLQSFPVPAAVGSTGFGTGTAITGQIQLPQTTTTTINTTVTVPDGGTVLLGGVKRMREQRLEYGVPVLAKTPLINRLFRNIGIGRRTDSLMLMVTPRIIILEEEEDRIGVRTINSAP